MPGVGDRNAVLVGGFEYGDQNGGLVVEFRDNGIFGKAVADSCDAIHGNQLAVGPGKKDDGCDIFAGILSAFGANIDLLALGAQGASGKVHATPAEGLGQLAEGQTVLSKAGL